MHPYLIFAPSVHPSISDPLDKRHTPIKRQALAPIHQTNHARARKRNREIYDRSIADAERKRRQRTRNRKYEGKETASIE